MSTSASSIPIVSVPLLSIPLEFSDIIVPPVTINVAVASLSTSPFIVVVV